MNTPKSTTFFRLTPGQEEILELVPAEDGVNVDLNSTQGYFNSLTPEELTNIVQANSLHLTISLFRDGKKEDPRIIQA